MQGNILGTYLRIAVKVFDREVQRCKRKYVKDQQKEIECLVNNDQQAFWEKVDKNWNRSRKG